jgi:hypothetical protein
MARNDGGIDYSLVGMNMAEIQRVLVGAFVGARKRGKRPMAHMIWGPPGAGKTFTTHAAARDISRLLGEEVTVYDNATSCLEPTDVAGVPTPVDVNGVTRYTSYLTPSWAYYCSKEYEEDMRQSDPSFNAPPAILFFDDIPAAHFQTQTAFFKGVHEGRWGDVNQRDNVMVIAAGNRVEDNAGANDMPTALANRFRHLYAAPTTDGWIEWAQKNGIHPYVYAYIRANRQDLNEFSDEVANRADKAFASPRSWESVSDFLWEGEIDRENDGAFSKVIMGTIGRGIATSFHAFLRNTSAVVPPELICKDPHKAKVPNKKSLDALHATIASLEHHIWEHKDQWPAAVIYATRDEMMQDFGCILANSIVNILLTLPAEERAEAMGADEFGDLLEKYEGALEVAA